MAVRLTRIEGEGFKKCCISNAMDGTDDKFWNDSEEDGESGVSVRKMKAQTVKVETVTVVGKGM
jgi:hypothetical protein